MKTWSVVAVVVWTMTTAPAALGGIQEKPAAPKAAVPGTAQAKGKPAVGGADSVFIKTAAMDGMAEVEHGKLAAQNAASSDVKQFAQRMVDDHGRANDELKSLASQKNVTLPTELDAKHKAMQAKLSKLKGAAFDSAYMTHMVGAHRQAVALFQREAKVGKDTDAKAFAQKTLPTLQEHLKMAQDVSAKSKKTQ